MNNNSTKLNFNELNLNRLNLNELKTILYVQKNISDDNKKIIQNIIQKKIINSININNKNKNDGNSDNNKQNKIDKINKTDNNRFTNKHTVKSIDEYDFNINIDSKTNTNTNSDTDTDSDIDRNKFCDKNNRKNKNQNITKTSEKLLNRLTSEALYINNIGGDITNISRPFSEEPSFTKLNELGKRKYIKKI